MLRFSNCKINLGLDIMGKRDDGYHNIVTVMVPVPWNDIIEIVPSQGDETTLTVYGNPVDCPAEKNLVMKAYYAVKERHNIPPVDIFLQKNIPDGAGLGGGSGDAATTIMILNDLFCLDMWRGEMAEIASTLGADCPFFIYERPMLCTGTGTTLRPFDIDLSRFTVLIAKPAGVSVSTKQAYAGVKPQEPDKILPILLNLPAEEWQGSVKNDFEPSVFAIAPQIGRVKDMMLCGGATFASMSGSGAAVFGLFPNDKMAEACKESLHECQCWIGKL